MMEKNASQDAKELVVLLPCLIRRHEKAHSYADLPEVMLQQVK